ncbi:MAG: glycosyltransferase family 2 protein [Comamonadaceae bacterium]|nr:glycosyltransferase family 2 protein [Comamonadaceae bacterium]
MESALHDRPADTEILIVDDGSTDGTLDWLYATFSDRPVRGLRNTRGKGPGGARNTGLLAARDELVALLDSDDLFLPGHLDASASLLAADSGLDVVFGRARYERGGQPVDYMGLTSSASWRRRPSCGPTRRPRGSTPASSTACSSRAAGSICRRW